MRRFRYGADPVFVIGVIAYLANRLWLAPQRSAVAPFFTQYFGDVLLIPCALPLLLWLQRRTGLRGHDLPPTRAEIFGALVLWSALFEWVFPQLLGRGVSDPFDVIAYAAGALIAGCFWSGILSPGAQSVPD